LKMAGIKHSRLFVEKETPLLCVVARRNKRTDKKRKLSTRSIVVVLSALLALLSFFVFIIFGHLPLPALMA
jgi:hypothetical protein